MEWSNHIKKLLHGQRGGVAILFALCLPVLLGFAALAVDLARLNLTKVELQNAADAAALGGARSISEPSTAPSDKPYNWTAALAAALVVARSNYANAAQIQDATIETVYWPSLLPSTSVPNAGDLPAIRATIAISSTQNNGPLNFFFAPLLGISQSNIQASAIAVLPPSGGSKGVFPVVINKALYDNYWNASTNSPKLDHDTGNPYIFDISFKTGTRMGGWTSFETDNNDTKTIKDFIISGNTTPLAINDLIWIQPGVHATLFDFIPINVDKSFFVVNSVLTKTDLPIIGIVGFHIIRIDKNGSDSFIRGQFLFTVPAGNVPTSADSSPMLVQ
ncbi:MAG: hypothetical protein LAC69_05155 [Chlorobium sp.]|jgi:Flp pilus assembly protein TadG|nr:hypothetical protein [Chlorobium sp.]